MTKTKQPRSVAEIIPDFGSGDPGSNPGGAICRRGLAGRAGEL